MVTSDDLAVLGGCGDGGNGVNAGAACIFHSASAGAAKPWSAEPVGKSWSWTLRPMGNCIKR